ncbi:MAG TPA: CD225/dispanin family protein [Flavobacteriaceae bacterium]|nr:CD225/dispanin family protein [Flavobacteriaceae bacterium]
MEQQGNIRPGDVQSPPENYLAWAIITTILCCWPIGIFAIIKSTSVNKLWQQGDFAGAQKASEDAKKYSIWAAFGVLIPIILYIILVVVLGVGGAAMEGLSGY